MSDVVSGIVDKHVHYFEASKNMFNGRFDGSRVAKVAVDVNRRRESG
jgi:hypothetical protein